MFAFDLNVFFDLVRDRRQSENARRIFGEALGHTIRLAVADEFVSELRRTSTGPANDPILQMALQIPRLPKADTGALAHLTEQIHEAIFERTQHRDAGTQRARSDANHVAHAALSKAAAFITRDGAILSARQELLTRFGIDIATMEEIIDLLPADFSSRRAVALRGDDFREEVITAQNFIDYCNKNCIPTSMLDSIRKIPDSNKNFFGIGIFCENKLIASGAMDLSRGVDTLFRSIVHVRHESPDADVFAEYIIEKLIRTSCQMNAAVVELLYLPGQSIVHRTAIARGFYARHGSLFYTKIAVGRPLTAVNWNAETQQIRRRTGLVLPADFESLRNGVGNVILPSGAESAVALTSLESLLSPTLIVWPGRDGVIVPIARKYADELLGTSDQPTLGLLASREAAFLSLRGYVNTPRAAALMRPGAPILFYESKKQNNGRGAVVAVARIVNSVIVAKAQLNSNFDKRIVIDDASEFSGTNDVLVTTFDNLMALPTLVPFRRLRALDAVGKVNLVSATGLSWLQVTSILTAGCGGQHAR